MIPQSVSFYEAEVAAKAQGDNLEFFPTDQILASELLRIIRAFKVEGYTVTFKGVTKMIGQPFGETVPVIWPKNAPLPKKKAPPPEKQDFAYPDLTNLREQMMRESEKP